MSNYECPSGPSNVKFRCCGVSVKKRTTGGPAYYRIPLPTVLHCWTSERGPRGAPLSVSP